MFRGRRCLGAAFVILAVVSGSAFAGDYADPSGFSFSYPEGWFAATKLNQADLPQAIRDSVQRNKFDLSRVSVVVLRQTTDEFAENLNVVVNSQQIPIEQASVNKLLEGLPPQWRTMGITVDKLQGELRTFGPNRVIMVEYQANLPGVPFPLRQRQVYIAGGGKTFIVTCTATPQSFVEHAPTFDGMLASFKAPAPSQGFDFRRVIMMGVAGGIVGGVIALLAALLRKKKST